MRNLRSQWKYFLRFCHDFHLVPLPASSSTISCFLVYLSQRTSSYRYILNQLNSIRVFHLYYDLPCGALSSFTVRLTTMRLRRLLGTHTNQKHPVTLDILRRIYGLLDTSIASQSVLWCLFLVTFFSFLRKSNLTTPCAHWQAFDPGKHLTRDYIKFTSQGAVLRIRWSKNAIAPRGYSPGTIASHSRFRALPLHGYSALLLSGSCVISFPVFLCTKWLPSFAINLLYLRQHFQEAGVYHRTRH